MPEYIYLIHPYRRELAFHPTPEEEAILSEHLAYLQKAASEGTVGTPAVQITASAVQITARWASARKTMQAQDTWQVQDTWNTASAG